MMLTNGSKLMPLRSRRKNENMRNAKSQQGSCADTDTLKDKKLTKQKRKLTPSEKSQKNGKQKRVKRLPIIDGIDLDDFIQRTADPIWLHQNEMWENMDSEAPEEIDDGKSLDSKEGIF